MTETEREREMLWVQWGEDCLSLHRAAQGCWRRISETKHDASEAEGPSSKAKGKKGRVTPGRGRGRREITHPLVCIESDKVQIPQGSRCDATE